jgi:hypothetical protein
MRRAAEPLTCGVAIEVPLMFMYPVGEVWLAPEVGTVEYIATPGADTSGFISISSVGPRELKLARFPEASTAPTVIA